MRQPQRFAGRVGGALALVCLLAFPAWLVGCKSNEERMAEHLSEAQKLIESRDFDKALTELRDALRVNPQSADVNFRIADLLERIGRYEDAIFFFGEAYRLDRTRTEAAVRQASLLIFDDPERMQQLIDEVLEADPQNAWAHIVLSRRAVIEERLPDALREAMTAVQLGPDEADAELNLAKVHEARIREKQLLGEEAGEAMFQAALAALDRASELRGDAVPWREASERAKLLAAWEGHEEEARKAQRAAVEIALQQDARAPIIDALRDAQAFSQRTRDLELLRWTLEQRVSFEPRNVDAWVALANTVRAMDGDGEPVYQRLLAEQPESAEARVRYAQYLAADGQLDRGVEVLRTAIDAGVEPPVLLGGLANLLTEYEREDEAQKVTAELQAQYPDHPRAVIARAQQAMHEGRYEDAAKELRALLDRGDRVDAHLLLASTERMLGNRRAALASADRVIEMSRGQAFPTLAVRIRSEVHAELGNCEEALRGFGSLTRQGKSLTRADRFLQGRCLYEIGRPQLGRSVLEKMLATKRPPTYVVVEYAEREAQNRPEEVHRLLQKVLSQTPDDPDLLTMLARMDLRAGRAAQALDRLNQAVATGRVQPKVLLERARVLAVRGDVEAAQQDALRAFEAQPSLEGASALLLTLYAAQGRTEEAISSFEEANAAGALAPPARLLLARLHMSRGNEKRAQELFEALLAENNDIPGVKNDLAYLLARENRDLDRALRLAQEAQRGLTRSPNVSDTLGYVYLRKGLFEPALEQFRYAITQAKQNGLDVLPVFHLHAGLALRELGRLDEAVGEFEQALALDASFQDAADALRDAKAAQAEGGGQAASAPSPS